jgi:hypothetical protein
VVTAQQGSVFHGTFKSAKATEKIVGVIGWGNKTIHTASEDGFMDGTVVNGNKINFLYEHVTPDDTVVLAVTWTRAR